MSGNRERGNDRDRGSDVPPHPLPLMHLMEHPDTILHHNADAHFKSATNLSRYIEQYLPTILG